MEGTNFFLNRTDQSARLLNDINLGKNFRNFIHSEIKAGPHRENDLNYSPCAIFCPCRVHLMWCCSLRCQLSVRPIQPEAKRVLCCFISSQVHGNRGKNSDLYFHLNRRLYRSDSFFFFALLRHLDSVHRFSEFPINQHPSSGICVLELLQA